MNRIRSAVTLLEAMISMTIFASILAIASQTLLSGTAARAVTATHDSVSDVNARTVQKIANLLRYADVNRIYLDGQSWTTTVSGSDYYSFKIATGFSFVNGGTAASLDRVVTYGKGVVLRFARNADGSGTLYSTTIALDSATGVPGATLEAERPLAQGLAWRYTPAGTSTEVPGFQVLQLDPTQASVVGNQIGIRVASFATTAPDGSKTYRDVYSTVYLRSSMYTGVGLLAPVITSPLAAIANNGADYIYDITATNDPTRYAASGLPTGLSVNTFSGRISGKPNATTGVYDVTISATNDVGSDTKLLSLKVMGNLPDITSPLVINAIVGQPISYQATANNSPTGFSASNLPPQLSLNGTTGMITGTISTVMSQVFTLTATNVNGTSSALIQLNVATTPPPSPVVTSETVVATSQFPFSYHITATNSPTLYDATGLPPGLTCNTTTGVISGTPTTVGHYFVTLSASNGNTGSGTLDLTVQEAVPVITSSATASGILKNSFTYQITATNSPTSFLASPLPSWMSLNSTGLLSGTPTVTGTSTIYLTARNAYGYGTKTLTLTVDGPAPPGIGLTNLTATAGVLFTYTPSVTPAVPTTWTVSGLPSGLALASASTGGITGKTNAIGTYTVTFTATNDGGTTSASTTLSVVTNPNAPVVTLSNDTAKASGKLQVLGTIAAASGFTLDTSTFACSTTVPMTLYRGWVPSEVTASKSSLKSNEFLLTTSSLSGSVTITAQVSDTSGVVGSATKSY